MSTTRDLFTMLEGERWLVARLAAHRRPVMLRGHEDDAGRREQIRKTIVDTGCQDTVLGRKPGGGAETYASAFERIYREPLDPKKTRRRSAT